MKDLKLQRKGNNFVESTLITMVENLHLFGVQMRHFGLDFNLSEKSNFL